MRVLAIAESIQPQNGAGRYTCAILKEYPDLGIDLIVATLKAKDKTNVLLPHNKLKHFAKNLFAVRRMARGVDVVHAFDVWPYGVYAYWAVVGTKKKLFMNGVGTYSVAPEGFCWKRLLMLVAYRRSDRIYCISKYTEQRIVASAPMAKTTIVPLGLTLLPKVGAPEQASSAKKYGIETTSTIIMTVGEIKHRKGQLDTLRAISLLKDKFPQIVYLLVGSDADHVYVDAIKSFAHEHEMTRMIRIITSADDRELAALYASAHIFCLNSNNDGAHFEGFGLVFLEAAQFCVPGIGSRNCGIESAILDGDGGYLTNQGDHGDIAEKLTLLMDPERRSVMGKQAQRYAKLFDWKKTAIQMTSEYGINIK